MHATTTNWLHFTPNLKSFTSEEQGKRLTFITDVWRWKQQKYLYWVVLMIMVLMMIIITDLCFNWANPQTFAILWPINSTQQFRNHNFLYIACTDTDISVSPQLHLFCLLRLLTFSQSTEVIELHVGRQRHVVSGDVGLISFLYLQIGRVTVQEIWKTNIQLRLDVLPLCRMYIKYS